MCENSHLSDTLNHPHSFLNAYSLPHPSISYQASSLPFPLPPLSHSPPSLHILHQCQIFTQHKPANDTSSLPSTHLPISLSPSSTHSPSPPQPTHSPSLPNPSTNNLSNPPPTSPFFPTTNHPASQNTQPFSTPSQAKSLHNLYHFPD